MLEIVKDSVDLFMLKSVNDKYHMFNDFNGYAWDLFLSCGDLSDLEYNEYRFTLNESYRSKEKVLEFMKLLETCHDIRIWTSKNDTESYLIFLYVMNLLRDKDCCVHVVYTDLCLGSYSFDEISLFLSNEQVLSVDEIKMFALEWDNVRQVNSPLRIICDGKIKNIEWNYLDDAILTVLKRVGSISVGNLIGELMVEYGSSHGHIGDKIFCKRIYDLIDDGKICVEMNNREIDYETVVSVF